MKDLTHLDAVEYFQIVWKRRWYVLGVFVLVAFGSATYAWLIPNKYKSVLKVVADSPFISEDLVRPTVRSTPEDRINSIREQLASRTFLERMIEQLQMYGYGTRSGFIMEDAVKTAQQQIGIEKTSNDTFTISFTATEPQFAQTVTRQLAQELIRMSTSSKKDRVLATDQFIDDQLRKISDELAAQEEKIKQFKIAHLGELPEQANALINNLSGLHSQLATAENVIQQTQERQKQLDFKWQEHKRLNLLSQNLAATESAVKDAVNVAGNTPTPTSLEKELAAKKALLVQYMAKYTPSHPDMAMLKRDIDHLEAQLKNQQSSEETATEPLTPLGQAQDESGKKAKTPVQADPLEASFQFEADSIKAEVARREKEKLEILQQIKQLQSRLNFAPAMEQQLSVLLREENILKAQYDNLQKQKFITQTATTVETDKKNETYRILDEANLPVKAEDPNRWQIILMGIGCGLLMGIGAAFGRELLDHTVGNEEEAKSLFNLQVLATIPTAPFGKNMKIVAWPLIKRITRIFQKKQINLINN
jgi:polysaccharide chain length determinant protein (PEP-CTERM system associated)